MAARDVASESHTGTTGSQGEASFAWSHPGAASGVKALVVKVYNLTSDADFATTVDCGGVDVPAVVGGFAADTAGEAGSVKVYALTSGVPQGTNTITVNRTNNAALLYATAATVTGANDTEITGLALEQENQALTEENVDDGSPGTDSVRFAGVYSGLANITAALVPGANSTLIGAIDVGANAAMSVWETTPGQGSRPVGCVGATDDVAAVYFAVREVVSGGVTVNATAAVLASAAQAATVTPAAKTVSATQATLTIQAQAATVTPAALTVSAAPAIIATAAQAATVTPAAKTIAASSATTAIQAQPATVELGGVPVNITASPATVATQAPVATVTPAALTVSASPVSVVVAAQAATVTIPPATRLYFGGLDTSPRFYLDPISYGAQWENVANAPNSTRRLWRDHPGYGFHQISRSKSPASDTADRLMAILVSNPLAAQTISGTAKAVARVSENAAGSDLRSQIVIRVMSDDLQTERGVLYAGDDGALVTEWSTTVTNRYFPQSGAATLSSVDVQDGDRLLVELGYRSHAAGTSGSGTIDLGDDGTDLPDNESNTTQGAPWIEFSQTLIFKDFPHGINLLTEDFTGTNGDPWPAEWTTDSIGVDSDIDINTNAGRLKAGTASTSDGGRGILDATTIDVTDADMYFRFKFDSLEPVSGSPSGAVVGLIWLRADGTWRSTPGTNDRPIDNGVGFEWWNNRPGTKIVEIFDGTVGHPSTDFECVIRQPVDTADTWVRLRLDGSYAAMKMWQGVKVDEPLDWQIETHAVQVVGTGQVQIVAKRDNSNGTVITSMFVDDFDIGDAGVSIGPVEILVGSATLNIQAQPATVTLGALTVVASPATVVVQAVAASVAGAVVVSASPASVAVAAQAATVTPAAMTISAAPALLAAQAQALDVALGATTVAATFATVAVLAQPVVLDMSITHYLWAAGRPIDRNKAGPPRSRWATTRPRQ